MLYTATSYDDLVTNRALNEVWRIDSSTGATALIAWNLAFGGHAIAYDSVTSPLYVGEASEYVLHTIAAIAFPLVEIEVKAPVHLTSPIPIPVAIVGSSTEDVTKIDVITVWFGPNGGNPVLDLTDPTVHRLSLFDINQDGRLDLVASFGVQDTGLALGDTQACLKGNLDGQPFHGCDDITVASRGCGPGFELAPILPSLLWLRGRRRRKPE